jgi:hypothetical protein
VLYHLNSSVGTVPNDSTFALYGASTVPVAAGDVVRVDVSAVVGSNTNGTRLDFVPCYQVGFALTLFHTNSYQTTLFQAGEHEVIAASDFISPPAGTYQFGLCMRAIGGAVDQNDFFNCVVSVQS